MRKVILTKQDELDIVNLYQSGVSTLELCKKYGWNTSNRHGPIDVLKKNGIIIRKDNFISGIKYTINEKFFEIIDTQEKAYILGLIYADGSIHHTKAEMKLSLQEQDKHVLEEINLLLTSNKPLRFYALEKKNSNWANQYALVIERRKCIEDLKNLGVLPGKSFMNLSFPNLDKHFISHFIRGYFDGDGCITFSSPKKYPKNISPIVSFEGSQNMLIFIQRIWCKYK